MGMDSIGSYALNSTGNFRLAADISVIKLTMDSVKQNSQAMLEALEASTKQIEHSVEPTKGGSLDIKV